MKDAVKHPQFLSPKFVDKPMRKQRQRLLQPSSFRHRSNDDQLAHTHGETYHALPQVHSFMPAAGTRSSMNYSAAKLLVSQLAKVTMPGCINVYGETLPAELSWVGPDNTPPHIRRQERLVDWLATPADTVRLILVTDSIGSHSHFRAGLPLVGQHVLHCGLLPHLPLRHVEYATPEEAEQMQNRRPVQPVDQDTPSILAWSMIEEVGALPYTLSWALLPLLPVQEYRDGMPTQIRAPSDAEITRCFPFMKMIAAAHPNAIWVPGSNRVRAELHRFALETGAIDETQVHPMQMTAWAHEDQLLGELSAAYQQAMKRSGDGESTTFNS